MQPSERTAMIGDLVRAERERQGLRQDELALAAGVSARTVFQVEQGKPTSRLDVLERVLDALGLALHVGPAQRTLGHARGSPRASFRIGRDAAGGYRWKLVAPNGRILASSETYPSKTAATREAREAAVAARSAEVDTAS